MKTNATNRVNRNNAVRAAAFEALEQRQMMSVSWSSGALTINGSNGNDNIVVDYQDYLPGMSQIRVRENNVTTQNWTFYQNAKGLTVYGNAGNDTIDLSAVKFGAVVFGGGNNDTVKGTKFADAIYGNEGDDWLYGNAGDDTMDGGAGGDTFYSGAGADALWGGAGLDLANYADRTNPVYVALDGLAYDGEVGENDNVHTDVECVTGGMGNDILTGNSADNLIQGNGGNDIIHGGAGKDKLFGGMVLGTAKQNSGVDTIYGEAGDDLLQAPSNGIGLLHGGADNDTLYGAKLSDDLYGDGGNDEMFAGAGNDNLWGGVGADTMHGGDGADVLVSVGGGNSDVRGEGGKDTFWGDNNGSEMMDFDDIESNAGRIHRVQNFESYKFLNGQLIVAPVSVSKDPLGQNLPDPAAASGTAFANFSNSPLFGPNGPSADDIRQGELGDCWYVSSLSSVARKNAGHLRNQAVPFGDGTFIVQIGKAVDAKYVRVDADFPVDGSGKLLYVQKGAGGSIWPSVFEKAEAVIHGNVSAYEMINGGSAETAFKELGGSDVHDLDWDQVGGEANLLKKIDELLGDGNVVGFGTMDSPDAKKLVATPHAYSVVKVNKDANGNRVSVTLRNPWAFDGSGFESGNPDDGYVTLTAHNAWVALGHISFGKF